MKNKIFKVHHGTYPYDILVCIGAGHKEIVSCLKRHGITLSEEETERLWMEGVGRTLILSGGQTILRVDTKGKANIHATLAHEIFHCVEFLFDRVGIKHDPEISGEVFAYQIGYITKQIYSNL